MSGDLSVKEVDGKEPRRKRPNKEKPIEKGEQEALEQGAESAKAAQKHMDKEQQSARKAQEVL